MSQDAISGIVVKSLFSSCSVGNHAAQIPEQRSFTFDEVYNLLRLVPCMNSKKVFEQYLELYSTVCENEYVLLFVCLALLRAFGEEKCVPYEYPLLFIYKTSSRKHRTNLTEYYKKHPLIGNCCSERILKTFLKYSTYFRKREDIKAVIRLIDEDIEKPSPSDSVSGLRRCKELLLEYLL